MPDLNELLASRQAKKLMNPSVIHDLQNAPETKRLIDLINQQSSGTLDEINHSVSDGDSTKLMQTFKALMEQPESKSLLEEISKKFSC